MSILMMAPNATFTRNGKKWCFKLIIVLLFSLFIKESHASSSCSVTGSTFTINYGDIIVQRDLAVMQPISNVIYGPNQNAYYCSVNAQGVFAGAKTQLTYTNSNMGSSRIYQTNLDGVGIMIGGTTSTASSSAGCYIGDNCYRGWNTASANWQAFTGYSNSGSGSSSYTVQPYIKLVKIGTITPGNLSGQLGSVIAGESYNSGAYTGKWYPEIPIVFGSGSIKVVACSIRTPSLTFPIGDVPASKFGSVIGTIPVGAQNTQNLGLDCDAGANINVALQGPQNPDVSTTSVLALTGQGSAGVAQGVGVQLLYNGAPLVLNNRIVLKTSAGGQETFPITAQYYQTKTAVTPGKANATATLDLTYQ